MILPGTSPSAFFGNGRQPPLGKVMRATQERRTITCILASRESTACALTLDEFHGLKNVVFAFSSRGGVSLLQKELNEVAGVVLPNVGARGIIQYLQEVSADHVIVDAESLSDSTYLVAAVGEVLADFRSDPHDRPGVEVACQRRTVGE